MDLGITGKKVIVCASGRWLGRGYAQAVAEAGCEVVINGLDEARLINTAETLRQSTKSKIIPVAADVSSPEGQQKLLNARPEPDIL